MKDPRIIKGWTKDGFTKVWRTPDMYAIKIGGTKYIPYQFEYDTKLKDYVWKFRKGGAAAGVSVS